MHDITSHLRKWFIDIHRHEGTLYCLCIRNSQFALFRRATVFGLDSP